MFDIGFWEILLIGVVTLLVVGPERLPGIAVFAGHWIGRLRRVANNMRDEISEELEAEHLKQLLAEQNREIDELRRNVDEVRRDADLEAVARDDTQGARGENHATHSETHPERDDTGASDDDARATRADEEPGGRRQDNEG